MNEAKNLKVLMLALAEKWEASVRRHRGADPLVTNVVLSCAQELRNALGALADLESKR